MEEISDKDSFILDDNKPNYYFNQNNSPSINKTKDNSLKYQFKFIISIIIGIMSITGYLISIKGLFDISTNNPNISNEFNITNFFITNGTCINHKYMTIKEHKNYYMNINNYEYSKNLSIVISQIMIVISLLFICIIHYFKYSYTKRGNPINFFLLASFFICIILFILELILFNILLYLFLRVFDIINFLNNNIQNRCIILDSWNYSDKVLKHLMKMIMILEILKICNIQLIIYFLKQLIVLNNFFYTNPNHLEIQNDLEQSHFILNE